MGIPFSQTYNNYRLKRIFKRVDQHARVEVRVVGSRGGVLGGGWCGMGDKWLTYGIKLESLGHPYRIFKLRI